ncbi:MAG TPA: PleD family two-component system response regulator [Hyphomonadaceae bacterium]|nr:PleD family two-component system response regulator [Hyphomonadaceae bacterium]
MSARVLVVDDIEQNRKLLQDKLKNEYFHVITAVDGQDAIDKALAEEPDVILMDVMMPRLNGVDACRQLKMDSRTEHIPIVLVTALNEREDRLRGLGSGADDFLTKPVNDLHLLSRVRALTKYKMVADELRKREASGKRIGVIDAVVSGRANEPARILVVDENERQARRICRYLEGLHRPISHSEATQLGLSGSMVDLMIVSLSNEKLDGLRLCAYFRSLESTRDLPILVVAEPDDEKKAVRALDLGASDIVIKPIDPEELSARVKTQVRKKRYLDALRARLDQSMELAVTDQLTGLHNRRYMRAQIEGFVKRSNMGGMPVSVLLCDIDHFKKVNDIHGHSAGDDVLREFGRRLSENIRPMDLACRYGGEEFVVIMPETTQGLAHAAAERIRVIMEEAPFTIGRGDQLRVTMSGGIATVIPPEDTVDALMKRADEALYRAKGNGRNLVEVEEVGAA